MRRHLNIRNSAHIAAAFALWLPAVAAGLYTMQKFSTTPGHPGNPPVRWPGNSVTAPPNATPALLLFLHPQCPCSQATVQELEKIVMRTRRKTPARIFFYLPASEAESWAKNELWRAASAIPGAELAVDRGGAAAREFGASTSGQVLLYAAGGRLLFKGGITPSRGHIGENPGATAVVALLNSAEPPALPVNSPVLGCSLRGEQLQ